MESQQVEKPIKKRQYWHIDAKWVCALLLALTLAATLPIAAAYQITAKEPATKLISYTLAGLTSPDGIDSDAGLLEIKQRILKNGPETVTLAGISVVFTENDINTLSPRELRLKVFGAFAIKFYDQGAKGFADSQSLDASAVEKFQKDSSTLSVFTLSAHNFIGNILLIAILIDVVLISGLVYFSYRFGKLVSLGIVSLLVGLPGIIIGAFASQHNVVAGTARDMTATNSFDMIGGFISFVAPLILPYFASTYLAVLLSGFTLLLIAGIGRIVYAIIKHRVKLNDGKQLKE